MSQAQDDLVARASDPNAELTTLHEIANNYPGLRPYVAENPRTYPALVEWLGTLGDPAVDAALARRAAGAPPRVGTSGAGAARAIGAADAVPGPSADGVAPGVASTATDALGSGSTAIGTTPLGAPAGAAAPSSAGGEPPAFPPVSGPTAGAGPASASAGPGARGAEPDGVFGVGTTEAEPERGPASGLWLWILGAVALVAVVSLVVWWRSSSDGGTAPALSAASTAPASQAPGSQSAAPAAPTPTPSASPTPTPTPSATPSLAAPAPAGAITMSSFTAPSGNITCTLGEDAVTCTINEHDFVPASDSCSGTSTTPFTVSVGRDGSAQGSCGQGFSSVGVTLDYGAAAQNDRFACTSSDSGVECWSQETGQGFSLARSDAQTTAR